MINLYYRIWTDLIIRAKSRPESRDGWELPSIIFMSTAMIINLVLIMTIFQKHIIGYYFYNIKLDFMPSYLGNIVSFIILFVFPCVALNYFLIFYKRRYKSIVVRYPYKNGKLFLTYFLISLFLPLVLIVVVIINQYQIFN